MSELEITAKGQGADARSARRTLKRRALAASRGGSADLSPLIDELDGIAAAVAPGERKKMGREIAADLRRANAARIRANVEPDDDPMVPRKARKSGRLRTKRMRDAPRKPKRSLRQQRMFQRAAGPAFLRTESSAGDAQVGFVGAMARIMRVHQYGLEDTVTRDPASAKVTYPARVVLGVTAEDRSRVLDRISARLA